MKTLKIDESKVKELYNSTKDIVVKQMLEDTFGKDFFIFDYTQFKTLSSIYKYLDINRDSVIPFKSPSTKLERHINACYDINKISEVLNEGWNPNFKDDNQYKYYPYFRKGALGWSVISCCYSCYYGATLGCGFYFSDSDKALFAGKTFLDVYIDYLPE